MLALLFALFVDINMDELVYRPNQAHNTCTCKEFTYGICKPWRYTYGIYFSYEQAT